MWKESTEKRKPLRTGLTTGTCATACAVASARALLSQELVRTVSVTLPKQKTVELNVTVEQLGTSIVRARTIKDAGDDPDVTHGATVFTDIKLVANAGVVFKSAKGVGIVTRAGLALEVGEPAINPVPRAMIINNLSALSQKVNYDGGFEVSIGIVDGEHIALKTMNPRLGIMGGLSILGTTGIVRPFSCSAWIASIHQGIDVASANGFTHIAASTGNTSERVIKNKYDLNDMALIEMGDFAGAVLKHLKRKPIQKVSICGGFGKITKLANGHMDLHSRVSTIDFKQMATIAGSLGADSHLMDRILQANTSIEALNLCRDNSIFLANAICKKALEVVRRVVPLHVNFEVLAIDRTGNVVGSAGVEGGSA